MGSSYSSRHGYRRRNRDSQGRRGARGEWLGWFVVYLILTLSLLAASFSPWFVLDDTDSATSIAQLIPYAIDGPDRTWLLQEAFPHGIVFLYTPFLLVPFLLIVALYAARDRTAPSTFLISLAGFTMISFGASAAVEESSHTIAYGFVVTGMLVMVAVISLVGFVLKLLEDRITIGARALARAVMLRMREEPNA